MNPSPMATRLAVFITAILISMSAYLPWVTGISGLGTASRSGLDGGGDGVFVLAFGLALGFTALVAGARVAGVAAILFGLLALGVAWLDGNNIATGGADRSRAFVAVSLGGGLYLLAFAGALSLIAGLMLLMAAFRRQGDRGGAP
jgi:hypothetical protein